MHARRLANTPSGLANSLRGAGAGSRPSVMDQLDRLSMPVLLVVGALDPKFVALAELMRQVIRDCRVEVVAGAGHTVHLERPDEFIAAAAHFLEGAIGSTGDRRWPPQA